MKPVTAVKDRGHNFQSSNLARDLFIDFLDKCGPARCPPQTAHLQSLESFQQRHHKSEESSMLSVCSNGFALKVPGKSLSLKLACSVSGEPPVLPISCNRPSDQLRSALRSLATCRPTEADVHPVGCCRVPAQSALPDLNINTECRSSQP